MEALSFLFKKLEILRRQAASRAGDSAWNVFTILRAEHDEVHLHSAFLAALLNPRGAHGCGSEFLALFLEMAGVTVDAPGDLERACVEAERRFGKTGQIDLLITAGRLVVVENKIHAADGDRQLERYHAYARQRATVQGRAQVLYLTLAGGEPPAHSLGALAAEELACLSYHDDVLRWLEKCVHVAARRPALRETLVQYETLIKKLTGQLMSQENREPTRALLAEGNNAVLAAMVVENWTHMKWRATWEFWQDLEAALVGRLHGDFPAVESMALQRFLVEALNRFFFYKRGKDSGFGLMLKLGRLPHAPEDVCLAVETGDEPSYYGITLVRGGTERGINGEPAFAELRQQIAPFSSTDDNDW